MTVNSRSNLGRLYSPLEELGESIILDLELYDPKGQHIETYSSSHAINDGLSLLIDSINGRFSRNWKIPLGKPDSSKMNLIQKALRLQKVLNRRQKQQPEFKLNKQAQPSKFSVKGMLKVGPLLLQQIAGFCEKNKVSVNSFLATAVFKSYSEVFDLNSSRWMIPVNIRQNEKQQNAPGMYSSYFLFPYGTEYGVQEVHQGMKLQLQSGAHWANYYLGTILSLLPGALIYWLTKRDFNKSTSDIVGSFSNLGSWPNLEEDLKGYSWAMFPTVRAHRPFGITVIQWGDSLTFAMRLHDSVEEAETKVQQFIELLQKNLLEMSLS